jgi:hypothetical protein
MDNTRRDTLTSFSRVPTKVVAKSADVLPQIASVNSGGPIRTPRLQSFSSRLCTGAAGMLLVSYTEFLIQRFLFNLGGVANGGTTAHEYKADL